MMMSVEYMRSQKDNLERHCRSLLNSSLKEICRSEQLSVSGTKGAMTERIMGLLEDAITSHDSKRFQEISEKIKPGATPIVSSSGPATHSIASVPSRPSNATLRFTRSPFFNILEHLTEIHNLPPMQTNKHSVAASIRLNQAQSDILRQDQSTRILIYCALDPAYSPGAESEIAFPNHIELRINDEVFSGNLRGVKKKSGTTRPADITSFIRKNGAQTNVVTFSYAATEKVVRPPDATKYVFQVNLARKTSVEQLVAKVRQGNLITKQTVIDEMINKAKDPDIEFTSTVMSLKCPISTMRMELPCRSVICNHNQCFDATSFLQMQEQAPQWSCPVCNKTVNFEALAVDQYVQDILSKTSRSVDQVTIEPNGSWRSGGQTEEFRSPNRSVSRRSVLSANDDDLVEISDHRLNGVRTADVLTPNSSIRTPRTSSREPSVSASISASIATESSASSKRKIENVIDLTLSDDDDDEVVHRPVKRQSMSFAPATPTSATDLRPPAPYTFNMPPVNGTTHMPRGPPQNYGPMPWYTNGGSYSGKR